MSTTEARSPSAAEGRAGLLAYIKEHSYKENHDEPFQLASGKKSPYYFDLKQTLFDPPQLATSAALMLELIEKTLGTRPRLATGLTMGADPLLYSIGLQSQEGGDVVYPIVIRKESKGHGSGRQAEGLLRLAEKTDSIVLIDDVITTGGSTLKAHEAIVALGFKPEHAFCLVDREEGGVEKLAEAGVALHSVFNLGDFKQPA